MENKPLPVPTAKPKHVIWTDHQFAAWLRKQDPNWSWYATGNANNFVAKGKVVALAFYDNTHCTRQIYIMEEASNG